MTLREKLDLVKRVKELGFDMSRIRTNNGLDAWWVDSSSLRATTKSELLELIIKDLQ